MVPSGRAGRRRPTSAPRASGDGPPLFGGTHQVATCSPRERGWSPRRHRRRGPHRVLPARAGMVPADASTPSTCGCAPRASGDGPGLGGVAGVALLCSPRERGWSRPELALDEVSDVLPARAGMVPGVCGGGPGPPLGVRGHRVLPARAGMVPMCGGIGATWRRCSPRERGWSPGEHLRRERDTVLPARAGMVRTGTRCADCRSRAPRASGDGPLFVGGTIDHTLCSPRERGWSPVGQVQFAVDERAPRASGDGPASRNRHGPDTRCSPRERGWSRASLEVLDDGQVLPARAGMVPRPASP